MPLIWFDIINLASFPRRVFLPWLLLVSFCSALSGAPGLPGTQVNALKFVYVVFHLPAQPDDFAPGKKQRISSTMASTTT